MNRRSADDILNPHRIFYGMIKDYADGRLGRKRLLNRALVVAVDNTPEGGKLESSPPNPPNSITARVYSAGMDANTPDSALLVFYPLLPPNSAAPISPGDHVFVMFEDEKLTNGLWVAPIPVYSSNLNSFSPQPTERPTTTADAFEGTSPGQSAAPGPEEFGGIKTQQESRRSQAQQNIIERQINKLQNKKILFIGDSFSSTVFIDLLKKKCADLGCSVFSSNLLPGNTKNYTQSQRIRNLVSTAEPDIVLYNFPRNDLLLVDSQDYDQSLSSLKNDLSACSRYLFIGSAAYVGPDASINSKILVSINKIKTILGIGSFFDSSVFTQFTDYRDESGLGFTNTSEVATKLEPWANEVINKI